MQHDWSWIQEKIKGPMIHESPDGGKTVRSRPSVDHPLQLLTRGILPVDIFFKLFGKNNESRR